MDYVVGSVAALISGNVTPNRPKRLKKPLTPMKHQPSPNVTPKSEFVNDRSIFLSPTMQKKKAIVKKSPKRIFQNPDLDVTNEDGESSISSPKADKVKKHLEDKLSTDTMVTEILLSPKSPKTKKKANEKLQNVNNDGISQDITTKSKKKKKLSLIHSKCELEADESIISVNNDKENAVVLDNHQLKPKKKRKRSKSLIEKEESESLENITEIENENVKENETGGKKKKIKSANEFEELEVDVNQSQSPQKRNKKKKKAKKNNKQPVNIPSKNENTLTNINPNAVTSNDTDSEHESDDEIHSENEEENKKTLDTSPIQESSDEEELAVKKDETKAKKEQRPASEDEIKRTIFVGNVPFSSKCKKEIKKIFSTHGQIETVRIRTVPVKDARVTPKLAVIKNELHPDRSTVNVYIKFVDVDSVQKALSENNTILNGNHLRVSRSDTTGATHDPKCSVFVGNIPFTLEDEALRAKFDKCGEIESVRIIRDKKTNAGKGFGYVNFASKDGVELALALTEEDLTFKNRIMRVKRCTLPTHKALSKQNTIGHKGQTGQQGSVGRRDRQPVWNRDRGNQFGRGKFGHDSTDGAYRRIKRKHLENAEGPPNKRQNLTQPKKARKEFVGMTSEKRTKQKFNKGQKKKKILSEILTK